MRAGDPDASRDQANVQLGSHTETLSRQRDAKRIEQHENTEHAGGAKRCTDKANGFVSVTNVSIGHSDVPSVEDDERISRWAQIQAVLDSWSMERDQH